MTGDDYELLDSGGGRKLERFGAYVLARPCSQALWRPERGEAEWKRADASFDREDGNRWHGRGNLPKEWTVSTGGVRFKLGGTDFGHLGVFPEQRAQWRWLRGELGRGGGGASVLNLFAYSGGSTIAAALAGASVCHLDASRGMVERARENARLNAVADGPIRWIVDDAHKFMKREIRRGRSYDAVVLDPPTFGRGAAGEMYKIERDLETTLSLTAALLSPKPRFVLFSSHTPGVSRIVAENVLSQFFPSAEMESGEMLLEGRGRSCPSGVYCRAIWKHPAAGNEREK
ncbi:MAG: class I SAM-dependent methyltransferase [Kiritimatiellae bacterium]|nr:class I SAM-dependent methyltransferase [Kiritimatiellia bacterium]